MIKIEDLAGVGLVAEENFAHEHEAVAELELAFTQGSQGWGVRRDVGVILRLARDLKIALSLAATADENGRMLKGAQMESGRIKKQRDGFVRELEVLRAALDVQNTVRTVAEETIQQKDAQIHSLNMQLQSLRSDNDAVPAG